MNDDDLLKDSRLEDDQAPNGITSPLSSNQAVKKALAAGFEAAADGVSYIREKLGIEISSSYFLAVKATERKKGWSINGKPGRKPKQLSGKGGGALPIEEQHETEDELIE